jgi:hypothetical protein
MAGRLTLALIAVACGVRPETVDDHPPPAAPSEAQRCRGASTAVAGALGTALEVELGRAPSREHATLRLLALTPDKPGGQRLLDAALEARGLTRRQFGRCLELEHGSLAAFEAGLKEHVDRARARTHSLPELTASEAGCRTLLPLTVEAKEQDGLPIALGAHMVLPCAGRVSERDLRCAIAEETLAHFEACQRGDRDPPPAR